MKALPSFFDPAENRHDTPQDACAREQEIPRFSRSHRASLTAKIDGRKGNVRRSFRPRVLAVGVLQRQAFVGLVDGVAHRAGDFVKNRKDHRFYPVPFSERLPAPGTDPFHAGILTPASLGGNPTAGMCSDIRYEISAIRYQLWAVGVDLIDLNL